MSFNKRLSLLFLILNMNSALANTADTTIEFNDPLSEAAGITKAEKERWLKNRTNSSNTKNLDIHTIKPIPYQPVVSSKIETELSKCLAEAKVSPQANECDREAIEKYIILYLSNQLA